MITNAVCLNLLTTKHLATITMTFFCCPWANSIQILGGIADTVAQSLTAIRQRSLRQPGGVQKDDFISIEIHELDKRIPFQERELIPASKLLPPPFDFERLTRFMAYGFMMSPIQFHWFSFLSRSFPITKHAGLVPVLKRVAFDQLIFAPFGRHCFVKR